jgi:hypothetical protein
MRRARPPALNWIDARVEEEVSRAQSRGEFDRLPGSGRPLQFDDDALVPEELRAALRVLRNAGFVPPEVQELREIGELERQVLAEADGPARRRALARLNLMLGRVAGLRGGLAVDDECYRRLVERIAAGAPAPARPVDGDQSS